MFKNVDLPPPIKYDIYLSLTVQRENWLEKKIYWCLNRMSFEKNFLELFSLLFNTLQWWWSKVVSMRVAIFLITTARWLVTPWVSSALKVCGWTILTSMDTFRTSLSNRCVCTYSSYILTKLFMFTIKPRKPFFLEPSTIPDIFFFFLEEGSCS